MQLRLVHCYRGTGCRGYSLRSGAAHRMVDGFTLAQPAVRGSRGSAHGGQAARPPDNSAHGGRPSPAAASLIYRMDPDKVDQFRAGNA